MFFLCLMIGIYQYMIIQLCSHWIYVLVEKSGDSNSHIMKLYRQLNSVIILKLTLCVVFFSLIFFCSKLGWGACILFHAYKEGGRNIKFILSCWKVPICRTKWLILFLSNCLKKNFSTVVFFHLLLFVMIPLAGIKRVKLA